MRNMVHGHSWEVSRIEFLQVQPVDQVVKKTAFWESEYTCTFGQALENDERLVLAGFELPGT